MEKKRRALEVLMGLLLLSSAFLMMREDLYGTHKVNNQPEQVVVVDAGHGGSDPGKVGVDGVLEKDVNLGIAQGLKEKLEEAGYRVVMTRNTDAGLYKEGTPNQKVQDLQNRCMIIEENKPVCTISIHQNSYTDEAVCGPQVFYFTHSKDAQKLAETLQNHLNKDLNIARPRVQKENSSYYILKRSSSVTVIVECGFLSNPKEAKLLTDVEYQDQLTNAIRDGIKEYLRNETVM